MVTKPLKKWQRPNWFPKFRSGDFSLKDQRSGRPVEVDYKEIVTTNYTETTTN